MDEFLINHCLWFALKESPDFTDDPLFKSPTKLKIYLDKIEEPLDCASIVIIRSGKKYQTPYKDVVDTEWKTKDIIFAISPRTQENKTYFIKADSILWVEKNHTPDLKD